MPKLPQSDLEHVFRHTSHLWEEARGSRIFVTGGTGFFGCWLVESFLFINECCSLGARMTVLTRDGGAFLRKCPHLAGHPALKILTGDVRQLSHFGERYDLLIHAATEASARQAAEQPREMLTTILEGTRRTLDFAAHCETKKLLVTSSGAIYGTQPATITHLPETYLGGPDCLDSASVYAECKRTSELMSVIFGDKRFEVKVARCFAFIGPHLPLDAHFAIGNFIRDALRGGPIVVQGDGTPRRSYLYAADLTIWLWTILFLGEDRKAYNVGSEISLSIAEVAATVADAIGPEIAVTLSRRPDSQAPLKQYVPSTARAQQELALRQYVHLSDAVMRTAAWHRQISSAGPDL